MKNVPFSSRQVCTGQEYQRKLHPDDLPLRAQSQRQQRGEVCHFLVRKNPNYPRPHVRKQLLLSPTTEETTNNNNNTLTKSDKSPAACVTCVVQKTSGDDDQQEMDQQQQQQNTLTKTSADNIRKSFLRQFFCNKCQNSLNNNTKNTSCDYCRSKKSNQNNNNAVYNPVYNIREIRSVSHHTFSSLGSDKKLMESATMTPNRYGSTHSINNNNNNIPNTNTINNNSSSNKSSSNNLFSLSKVEVSKEQVNANPSKGFGNFVYI